MISNNQHAKAHSTSMEDRMMGEHKKKMHCLVQYHKHVKEVGIADKYLRLLQRAEGNCKIVK
jgi:hypothetical protein